MKEWFDLQLFADAGGDTSSGTQDTNTAEALPEGLPNTDTVLGSETKEQEQDTTSQVPEAYDFSGVVKEVFGDKGSLDDTVSQQFTDLLKGVHATQEQADAMAKFGMQYAQHIGEAVTKQIQQSYVDEVNGWADAAKQELGDAFEDTVAKACTTRNYLEQHVPGFTQMLNLTGAGNHVAMMRAMAAMASLIGEDQGMANGGNGGAKTSNLYPNTNWDKY